MNAYSAKLVADIRESTDTPRSHAHYYGTLYESDFPFNIYKKRWKVKVTSIWSNIRVAVTWNSKTRTENGEPASSELDADIDLLLYDPDGYLVASSMSWDNNYEFIEYTPKKIGDYTIVLYGWDVPKKFWSYYGIAWTTYGRFCIAKVLGVLTEEHLLRIATSQSRVAVSLNEFLENTNISREDVDVNS